MFLRELLCIQNKECLLPVLSDKSWAKWETDDETKQYQSITVYSLSLRRCNLEFSGSPHFLQTFCPATVMGVILFGSRELKQNLRQRLPSPFSAVHMVMVTFYLTEKNKLAGWFCIVTGGGWWCRRVNL